MANNNNDYDRKTLISAAALLIGFGVLLYYLPPIMKAIGQESLWLAAAMVAVVIVLPFAVLWLRGRMRRRK